MTEVRPLCRGCLGDGSSVIEGYAWERRVDCEACDGTGFVERRGQYREVRAALDAMASEAREPFVALLRWYDDLTDKQLAAINTKDKIIRQYAEPKASNG